MKVAWTCRSVIVTEASARPMRRELGARLSCVEGVAEKVVEYAVEGTRHAGQLLVEINALRAAEDSSRV